MILYLLLSANRRRVSLTVVLAAGLLIGTSLIGGVEVRAVTTITVNTNSDELNNDGDCSLREAIRAANLDQPVDQCPAGSGADFINLPTGVYTLTVSGLGDDSGLSGDLDITGPLTIVGMNPTGTIIDGSGANVDRVFQISNAGDVEISSLTIRNGDAGAGDGGGIRVSGSSSAVTLRNMTVSNNRAGRGGGIYMSTSAVTLINTTVINNRATVNGGGVYNNGGNVLITKSEIGGNNVSTAANASGVQNTSGGIVILTSSTMSGNGNGSALSARALRSDSGNLTVVSTTLSANTGVAIEASGASQLSISSSTLSGNQNTGISIDAARALITNTTLSGNLGPSLLARNGAAITVTNSTFYAYTDGITNVSGAINLKNTIIGGGCSGTITSLGYNLDRGDTCNLRESGDLINVVNPGLGDLEENGGPTKTHALSQLSPAKNVGDPDNCPPPSTDQTGSPRPYGGRCDIGAYEWRQPSPTYALTANASGSGSVSKNPNKPDYDLGEMVMLMANPSSKWTFIGWSGDLTGAVNPTQITMTGNKTVTAIFVTPRVFLPVAFKSFFLCSGGPSEIEPNDVYTQATSLMSPGSYSGCYNGDGNADDHDYFTIVSSAPGMITVDLTNTDSSEQLWLTDRNDDQDPPLCYRGGPDDYHCEYSGPAETYYIRVVTPPRYKREPYTLTVTFPDAVGAQNVER